MFDLIYLLAYLGEWTTTALASAGFWQVISWCLMLPEIFNYAAEEIIIIRPRPFFISHREDPRGGPLPPKMALELVPRANDP